MRDFCCEIAIAKNTEEKKRIKIPMELISFAEKPLNRRFVKLISNRKNNAL
jgi:hypothetical protein